MPNKDHINNGSLPVEDAGIHRGKSITKSFKSLFSSNNNSSDNLQSTKKDPSLAHIASLNSAALSAKDSAEIKSQSSNDSLGSSLRTSDLHANSNPASPMMKVSSPVLPLGKALNPASNASVNNLIDQELNTINKNIINNPNSDMNGLSDRSSSRGRNKLKATQSIKSKDNSPQGSSREPSLSPQRSLKQYRNRGMSVSQANFAHSPFPNNNSDSSQHIKRSATLVKGMHHGDGKGIVVNNRHMIWESETFKLYRNFTHEHKLSALPLIDVNPNLLKDPEAMKEALEQRNKDAPTFSISTLFKLNKTSQQVKEQNDEKFHLIMQTSKGYIPSKAEIQNNNLFNSSASHCKQVVKIDAYCSMKKKRNIQNPVIGETEANENGTPCIVNTKAAISKDELHLINDLTTRMKTIIDDNEQQPVATIDNKESEFVSKYGYCAGTLGQGSYGVVKVTCRKLKQNPDAETKGNAPYIVDNIAKKSFRFRDSVFFAVKELQADRKNVRKVDSDDEDSMNGSFMDDESSEADSDSKSTTLSDNIRIKLTKHRKRKNKDYNAKFCTRLTSEFVIGHALNNIGRHPNILKIFDLYQYDNISNKFLQVMEFCPSGDLHSLIKRTAVNGNGKTISREIQLPPIGPGPVFVGDNLNLMDGGTSFSLNTMEGQGKNEALPEKPKLSGSQQNLLDSLIVRKQEKHTLLHPLEIDCFMKQIINGVAFMHEHGVAHCDLKPENILIKPNGILKLSDFGTSCVFQTAWEKKPHYQKGCFGSEPYMAPEQFIPHKQYDPRLVDTFAVGIIYVTMALGHYPWKSPVKEKDPDYAEFVDSLKVVIPYNAETKQQEIISGEYEQFEEMTHVNAEMKLLRKKCLYRMLHPNPNKRVLVKDVLNSNWMKRTHCCVIYKANM
jgi:serine/threonine protein kinase